MSYKLVNEQFFPKGSEWIELFKPEYKKVEITLSSEYINQNQLQEAAEAALINGWTNQLGEELKILCIKEENLEGLEILIKLFTNEVYFTINLNNGNLTLFNEEEEN